MSKFARNAFIALAITVSSVGAMITSGGEVSAASASDWRAGNIIDDRIFYRGNDLSQPAIQQFLNTKVPTCDTWGNQSYGSTTRASYGTSRGYPPPYTCLKDYTVTFDSRAADSYCQAISGGTKNAATIIFEISNACGISARVLLVMLEKEQGLVSDDWPWGIQYRGAMGYGCPDTAPCDAQYYGLFNQVYNAARQFKLYAAYPTNYRYKPYQTNFIYWNPNSGCGGSNVYIENKATAGLYNYTPYQPNQAALNAVYGMGDGCSAYGNRNFFNYFTDWFGNPRIQILASFAERYAELGGENGVLGKVTANQVCGLRNGGCYQSFEKGGLYWSQYSGTFESYGPMRQRYIELGAENSSLGYPNEQVICGLKDGGCYQRYQGGVIYYSQVLNKAYENMHSIRERYVELGAESGSLGYPASSKICGLRSDGCYQGFERGAIYWSLASGTIDISGPPRERYMEMLSENGPLGYPTSPLICGLKDGGCVQFFQYGKLYLNPSLVKAYEIFGNAIKHYDSYRNENGSLGYPTSVQLCSASRNGCRQDFQNGTLYYATDGSAKLINQQDIKNRWYELGAQDSPLGQPLGNTTCDTKNNGCYLFFQNNAAIFYSSTTGARSIGGGIYQKWHSLGKEWGRLGFPTSNEYYPEGTARQDFEGGSLIWKAGVETQVIYN